MSSWRGLLEISVAGFAIGIAGLFAAVPSMGGAAPSEVFESAAIASLQEIVDAQRRALESARFDRDDDGRGEHAGLAQLAAAGQLAPAFSRVLADGSVERGGYRFQAWLPAIDGRFVPADLDLTPIDPDRARIEWRVYAWPIVWTNGVEESGWSRALRRPGVPYARRAFCVDQSGELRAMPNLRARYRAGDGPTGDAAYRRDGSRATSGTEPGGDGETWFVVR